MSFAYSPISLTGMGGSGQGRITVGNEESGARYNSIAAAIEDGHNDLILISDLDEFDVIETPVNGLYITIEGAYTLDLGDGGFNMYGLLSLNGGAIVWSGDIELLIASSGPNAKLHANNVRFQWMYSGTTSLTYMVGPRFTNCTFVGNFTIGASNSIYMGCEFREGDLIIDANNVVINSAIFMDLNLDDQGSNNIVSSVTIDN